MLYLIAIVQRPTEQQAKEGVVEKLVLPPSPVIAKDDKSAAAKAVIENREKFADVSLDNIDVLVRPF